MYFLQRFGTPGNSPNTIHQPNPTPLPHPGSLKGAVLVEAPSGEHEQGSFSRHVSSGFAKVRLRSGIPLPKVFATSKNSLY